MIVKSSYFSNICTYENAQFAIKYYFLILGNVYSSKKRVDSEFNSISLKNGKAIFSTCPQNPVGFQC